MKIRSTIKAFHPSAEMKCLTKGRIDIVAIQRGDEKNSIFAIHNMTDNKLDFSINDSLKDESTYFDYLSGKEYFNLNLYYFTILCNKISKISKIKKILCKL